MSQGDMKRRTLTRQVESEKKEALYFLVQGLNRVWTLIGINILIHFEKEVENLGI